MRLIDADALYKKVYIPYDYSGTVEYEWSVEWKDIKEAPTIDPESLRPVGEWKLHNCGKGTCSRCNFTQSNVWDDDNWQNFCGVCGARMKGVYVDA